MLDGLLRPMSDSPSSLHEKLVPDLIPETRSMFYALETGTRNVAPNNSD